MGQAQGWHVEVEVEGARGVGLRGSAGVDMHVRSGWKGCGVQGEGCAVGQGAAVAVLAQGRWLCWHRGDPLGTIPLAAHGSVGGWVHALSACWNKAADGRLRLTVVVSVACMVGVCSRNV